MNEPLPDPIEDLVFIVERMQLDPSDTVVISTDNLVDDFTRERMQYELQKILPGHSLLILDQGMRISAIGHGAGITRIEEKLDRLIEALAEDGIEPPARSLDGDLFPSGERDQTQPL